MTRFAQVSDLHFGRHDPHVADLLLDALRDFRPDVVVVSGDLTQRARSDQFAMARAWLDRLGMPWLAVPGNHDLPLYDVLRRAFAPYARWRRHIGPEDETFFGNAEVAILGLNTARRNRWKEGRIGARQVEAARRTFLPLPASTLRILVTHHPFLPASTDETWTPMARGAEAMQAMRDCGLDLLLSGHQHRSYSADVRHHYEKVARTLLVAHAGTAISTRTRHEPNTFNAFTYHVPLLELEVRTLTGEAFVATGKRVFRRGPEGWTTEG